MCGLSNIVILFTRVTLRMLCAVRRNAEDTMYVAEVQYCETTKLKIKIYLTSCR